MNRPALTILAAAVLLSLSGCATLTAHATPAPTPTVTVAPIPRALTPEPIAKGPVTFAVAGDSITAWLNYSYPAWNGYNDPHSWAGYAIDARTVMLGGYARSGVGVVGVAANIRPTGANVLVIHLTTNDYKSTPEQLAPYLDAIVATEASPHVVVVGIPPLKSRPEFVMPENMFLASWADLHDYTYVNPYLGLVTTDGSTWLPGFSADGIHPLPSTAALTGPIIREAIHRAAGRA